MSPNSLIIRINLPAISGAWGEDFCSITQFPPMHAVMVGIAGKSGGLEYKPYTPIEVTEESLDLLVKEYVGGKVSGSLAALNPGDAVFLKGPREKLSLPFKDEENIERFIAFAAGTGIAPIYQLIKYVNQRKLQSPSWSPKVHLIYANRSEQDILLHKQLQSFSNFLSISHVLEDCRGLLKPQDIPDCRGETDRVLVCGPRGFNQLLLGDDLEPSSRPGLLHEFTAQNLVYKF